MILNKSMEPKVNNNEGNTLVSEYKIGHTTYTVELHFNFDRAETLDDIVRRLMLKDSGAA